MSATVDLPQAPAAEPLVPAVQPGESLKPKTFPLVDHSRAPSAGLCTSFCYWSHYVLRHYLCGPKYGPYGPKAGRRFLKWAERRIEAQSQGTGENPVREVPRVKAEDLSAEDFQKTYLASNTPVVIEGLAREWDAVKT